MENKIRISVVMSAYNASKYIANAILSVLNQTFPWFELIIINDGSTDDTVKIIQSFTDHRIVLLSQPHKGIAAALNNGIAKTRTDYIARFDADDICYPDRLEKQFQVLYSNPQYSIVGSAADYIDENGEFVFTYHPPASSYEEIQKSIKSKCPFIHSTVLCKKEAILKYGGYNNHAHTFEDHFLWLHVLKTEKGFNIQDPLIQVRLNPQSVTIDEKWRTKRFHKIRNATLLNEIINEKEGQELYRIICRQNSEKIKQSAYNSILAKKYLWNNYQPLKARKYLRKVITQNKLDWKSYLYYCASFLPANQLQKLYRLLK